MTEIDLFISHSTQDDAIVSQIHDLLEASGINVWVDHEDGGINVGDEWSQEIDLAVNTCQAGLCRERQCLSCTNYFLKIFQFLLL